VSTLLLVTVYMFLYNLLNVLVQIANKIGLKTNQPFTNSSKVKIKAILRPKDSRSSFLAFRHPSGAHDQTLLLSNSCLLTRGRFAV
jgi:hypothetical protein